MVLKFPEFSTAGQTLGTFTRQVWNSEEREWDIEEFTLPVADGKALVLVPES